MSELRDVVVVGAGPAGAAMGIFLHQRGHDVVVLDEATFPRDKVCGEGISPEAWRLLDALGAAASVRALRPRPLRGMTLVAPDGTSFTGTYAAAREPGFALRREAFDAALLDRVRASGIELREKTRAAGLVPEQGRVGGVIVENELGPQELRARVVVGADGRRSVVARRLGLLHEHPRWRKFAVRGYWDGVDGLGDYGEMHVGGGGYCGIAPLSPSMANVTFVLDRRDLAAAAGDIDGFYRRTLGRWPRVEERVARARLLDPPRAIGPLALEARRLSAPGALLVGDAAGFYDPFTGEGVTLALRSAEIAAGVIDRALRDDRTDDLSSYDRLRHQATRHKFRLNRLIQRIVAWPDLANLVGRRLACRPDLADRLVGIAGDFIPARSAFDARFLWELLAG